MARATPTTILPTKVLPGVAGWSRPPEEVTAILARAEKGDTSVLPTIREMFAVPGVADVLGGDLTRKAEEKLLAARCGTNLAAREAVAAKMVQLRADLAGPSPTPVERLLAERAVLCWLHLNNLEVTNAATTSMTVSLADYYQRAIDRAHRRYLSALKALAEVRKLNVTVQLNLARKQVNIAAPAPARPRATPRFPSPPPVGG